MVNRTKIGSALLLLFPAGTISTRHGDAFVEGEEMTAEKHLPRSPDERELSGYPYGYGYGHMPAPSPRPPMMGYGPRPPIRYGTGGGYAFTGGYGKKGGGKKAGGKKAGVGYDYGNAKGYRYSRPGPSGRTYGSCPHESYYESYSKTCVCLYGKTWDKENNVCRCNLRQCFNDVENKCEFDGEEYYIDRICPVPEPSSMPSIAPSGAPTMMCPSDGLDIGAISFNQDATPNALFGVGNTNGFFTCRRLASESLELCLRARQRFDVFGGIPASPNGVWSNMDGTYTVPRGSACDICSPGFSFAPCSSGFTSPIWNFEWSINTDYDDVSGNNIDQFQYEIGMDGNPGCEDHLQRLYIMEQTSERPFWTHSFGGNTTPQSGGAGASTPEEFTTLKTMNNVAQNSWNYEFFNGETSKLNTFDSQAEGNYIISLKAGTLQMSEEGKILPMTDADTVLEVRIQIITDATQTLEDPLETVPRTCP